MTTQRATKKQKELLSFVDGFIQGHGYGPSYREVMRALGYKSVSTVAIHIDQLIAKGYLAKTDNSARSLSVVTLREHGVTKEDTDDALVIKKAIEHRLQTIDGVDEEQVLIKAAALLGVELSK